MATATEDVQAAELERARQLGARAGDAADEATIRAINGTPDAELSSIDDLAEKEEPTPPMQIPIPGTTDNVSLVVGGAKPTITEVRLLGGAIPVVGEFKKGDEITLVVTAKVGAVEFVDSTDEWGTVTKTIRRHKMRMTSCKRAAVAADE